MHMYYSILIIRFLILGSVLLVAKPILGSPSSTSSTTAGGTTASTSTIPRSSNTRHFLSQQQPFSEDDETFFPPWNPSQKIDDDGFLVDIYCCVPGEWEQETTVGGRYADLRKKTRFLFGVSNTNPSGTTTTTNGRNNPAAAASRTSIPFGGSLRSSSTRSTSPSLDGLGTPSITSTTYPSSSELHNNNNNNNMQHDILEETSEFLMCRVRQVPGDGNCLFHSVSACLSMAENRTHIDMRNTTHLRRASAFLREQAVEFLQKHPRRLLFLQGKESWPARDLLEAAASQFNISGEEYCHLMKQDAYWGGGPEIVALSNFLCRPIHVYKLACEETVTSASQEEGGRFVLQRMACFGSPKFDRKEPLHILSADSRFPDISPGRQLPIGNHFLALFPYSSSRRRMRKGQ